jgi:predicted AAA+ superfamily ATPase
MLQLKSSLSYEEFLVALGQNPLVDYLNGYALKNSIPQAIHEKLMAFLKEYIIIGGMPAAVSAWITHRSLQEVHRIQYELLATHGVSELNGKPSQVPTPFHPFLPDVSASSTFGYLL